MQLSALSSAALAAVVFLSSSSIANAQIFESVGTRAQGMAGAFVAVADDANASWWNPAGLATGAYLSAVVERGSLLEPSTVAGAGPASERHTTGISFAFPALGVSYYRLRISDIRAASSSTEAAPAGRQDQGAGGVVQRSISISEFSAVVGQSVSDHLVVASRLKLVRAGVTASIGVQEGRDALDRAADADVSRDIRGSFDVGVMVSVPHMRIGLNIKNVNEPEFGSGANELRIDRQARAGVAFFSDRFGPMQDLVASADADLTRTPTPLGDVRHVAAGAEAWLFGRRLGLRGGVSADTAGSADLAGSGGLSVGFRTGLYVDGAITIGRDSSRTGWGAALRASF
jgi:hypothetical protein